MAKKPRKKAANAAQSPTELQRPPTKFVARLTLSDEPRSKSRRRKAASVEETVRVPTEAELREQAAWKQVEETGKPVQLGDELLIPEGMSAKEALEFLPDGIREQTQAAWKKTFFEAFFDAVRRKYTTLEELADKNNEWAQFKTFSYAGQMAIAESLVRRDLNLPEAPIEELIERYGGKMASKTQEDKTE